METTVEELEKHYLICRKVNESLEENFKKLVSNFEARQQEYCLFQKKVEILSVLVGLKDYLELMIRTPFECCYSKPFTLDDVVDRESYATLQAGILAEDPECYKRFLDCQFLKSSVLVSTLLADLRRLILDRNKTRLDELTLLGCEALDCIVTTEWTIDRYSEQFWEDE